MDRINLDWAVLLGRRRIPCGVIQAPGGRDEDGDYPYGGWTAPYRDPVGGKAVLEAHANAFDLLLGRRTYDIWSAFWPKAGGSPLADSLNAATKYVATYTPATLEWGPFEGVGPDSIGDVPASSNDRPGTGSPASSSTPTRSPDPCKSGSSHAAAV